jgi:heterodisulfide reductase subunit C2
MSVAGHVKKGNNSLAAAIKQRFAVKVERCYQCGKCSAGCPLADEMDFAPSMILRMLQTEDPKLEEKVLGSYTIWLCLSCETCYTRCPMEVELPQIMDYLRNESYRQKKVNPRAKDILAFQKSFLDSIRITGRLYEIGLISGYKARTWHFLQDVLMAPRLFFKGKLKALPHTIKDRSSVEEIFKRCQDEKKENEP